ncbi:MAG: hypothetical protein ACI9FU_000491 [Granulosicoccus sp.]|jgi:hypothetical protein
MGLKTIALFIGFVLASILANAQEYAVKQFTVDDGLPSSHVYEVKQDSKGFYWIATSEGLVRYDGYKIEQIGEGNSPFNRDVWWSHEDSQGKIWGLGHGNRLWYLEKDTFSYVDVSFAKSDESTVFIRQFEDEHDRHWLILGRFFYGFKDGDYTQLDIPEFLNIPKPIAHPDIIQSDNGSTFLVTLNPVSVWSFNKEGGLDNLHKYSSHLNYGSNAFPNNSQNESNTTIIITSPDSIYLADQNSMVSFINGEEENGTFPSSQFLSNKSHRVIKLKNKYAFLLKGKNFVTDQNFNHLPEFDFILDLNINTVYQDHESSIWISTSDQGMLYITKDALAAENFTSEPERQSEVISIEAESDGSVWIGYKNGSICQLKDGEIQCRQLRSSHSLEKSWYLHNFLILDDRIAVVVGDYKLFTCPTTEFLNENNHAEKIINLTSIKRLSRGYDNHLYVTDYWKSFRVNFDSEDYIDLEQIGAKKILATTLDAMGRLLVSSYSGLYAIGQNGDSTLISKNVLVNKFEFYGDDVYALDKSRGVHILDLDAVTPINALRDYLVKDLWFEGDSVIWAATNSGLIQLAYDPTNQQYQETRKLTLATGLPSNDVTAIHTNQESLFIGTSKGFTVIDRSMLSSQNTSSSVQVTKIFSANQALELSTEHQLHPSENALRFEYVYVSPRSAGHIKYQFQLEGIDQEWRETEETSIFYPFIPPGEYTFRLKATDIDGIPSKDEVLISIKVEEYWYKTSWFLLAILFSSIVITALVFRWRTQEKLKRELEHADVNKRLADLKLNALRSQMNPHFVFNVLNSIQESFMNDDLRVANKHMTDFSKLMRLFLETSNDRHNLLVKEVQILTYYIELERMRLKSQFEIEFVIDDGIDQREVFLPSMLLQPIIENAILHGLRYKDENGSLTITIDQHNSGSLTIAVEDDGVGRKRSTEINAKRKGSHKSMASAIIYERVELLNSSSEDKIEMTIHDLEKDGKPAGTRVELNLDLEVNRET